MPTNWRKNTRWIVVPLASYVTFYVTQLAMFLFLIIGVADTGMYAFMTVSSFCAVLVGSIIAPTHRVATGAILSVVLILVSRLPTPEWIFILAGGVIAILLVRFWPRPVNIKKLVIVFGVILVIGLGELYARYKDWPAHPDPLPSKVVRILGSDTSRIRDFYTYNAGGFIDSWELWRIDAPQSTIEKLAPGLGEPTQTIPKQFYDLAPYYWPRSMPSHFLAYQSKGFVGNGRGEDGTYYFLLYDIGTQRAYVWIKNNF